MLHAESKRRKYESSTAVTRKIIEPYRWRRNGTSQRVTDRARGRARHSVVGWEGARYRK
jgi:hypothetical protein